MGLFDGFKQTAYEAVLPSVVVPLFRQYAGQGCKDLKIAILLNVDLYQIWVANAEAEKKRNPRLWTPDEVRNVASRFRDAKGLITVENVRKWLKDQGCQDILLTVDTTPGGRAWLDKQVSRFKMELF